MYLEQVHVLDVVEMVSELSSWMHLNVHYHEDETVTMTEHHATAIAKNLKRLKIFAYAI